MIDSGPRPHGRGPVVFATWRWRASVTFRYGHGSALHRSNFSLVIRRALWKPDDVGAIGPGVCRRSAKRLGHHRDAGMDLQRWLERHRDRRADLLHVAVRAEVSLGTDC